MAFCDRSAPAQQDPPRVRDASGPSADAFTFPPATAAMTTQLRTSKGDASVSALPACVYSPLPAASSHTVVTSVQHPGVQQVQAQAQQHPSQQDVQPLLPQEQWRNAAAVSSDKMQTLGSPAGVAGSTALRSQGGGIGGAGQDITGTGVAAAGGIATASEVGNTVSTATAPAHVHGGCPGGTVALFYMRLPLDEKKYVTEQARDEAFRRLRRENRTCFDCASRNPTWLSTTYGVYLCLSCSGKHRRLGTHISFVRSCEMDNFTPEQLLRMELGGNKRAHEFFREHGLDAARAIDYHGKLAARYKQQLDKLVTQEMHAAGWRLPNSATPSGVATAAFVAPAATALQQQQQNIQQQQQQTLQQHQGMLGSGFDVAPSSVAPLAAAPAAAGLSHAAGSLQQNSMDCFFSPTGPTVVTAPAPTPLSFAPSNRINSSRAAAAAPRGGRSATGAAAGGGGVLLSQSSAVTAAPPPVAGTLRARKLDVDFDFEKEIAASTRAGAGAPQHSFQKNDGSQTGGLGMAQQRAGAAADVGTTTASNVGGLLTLGPQASASSSTTAPGGGGGKGALAGLHPSRFTNAKSISSEQYFGSSSTERPAASFAAAVAVDPHKRSISSDEYFGIDNTKNRGKLSVFEDQAVVRLDSLKMAAQQGWATVASVGTDAMNRAKDWLQGS